MNVKNRTLWFISVIFMVAIIDFAVPYLFLKDVIAYWANYVFWLVLTITVIIGGALYVRDWGEK